MLRVRAITAQAVIVSMLFFVGLVWAPQAASSAAPGEIRGRTWYDTNGNKTLDPDERAVNGAIVWLMSTDARTRYDSTTSDSNGAYRLSPVAPGEYTIWATDPYYSDNLVGIFGADLGHARVAVSEGQRALVDFAAPLPARRPPPPRPTLTGLVFLDRNGNGVLDPGEERISKGALQAARPGNVAPGYSLRYLDGSTYNLSLNEGAWWVRIISGQDGRTLVGQISVGVIENATLAADIGLKPLPGPRTNWDIPNGHFYTQTNGYPPLQSPTGYSVVNDALTSFWSEFQRLGGVDTSGYPMSRRFVWDGFVTQVFQRAVFQWRPEENRVFFINVFDELSKKGLDDWLFVVRSTPKPLLPEFDAGKSWEQIVTDRLALLDNNPAIKAKYYEVSDRIDPMLLYGLPTSRVTDMGNHWAIRLQRAVMQQWKEDMPWARAGQVTVANGGDIAVEAGLIPKDVLQPEEPPVQ